MNKIHGEWEITLVNQVLVRSFAGHFNEHGTQALFEEYKQKAPVGQRWASLAHATYWEMSTQSSLRAYNAMRDWAFDHGCERIVLIYPSVLHLHIIEKQTGMVATKDFYPCKTIEAAAQWLTEQGFPFSASDFPHADFIAKARHAHDTHSRYHSSGTGF